MPGLRKTLKAAQTIIITSDDDPNTLWSAILSDQCGIKFCPWGDFWSII